MILAVVASQFNGHIVKKLLQAAKAELNKAKVKYKVFEVPGAFEIPLMAKKLAETGKYRAIITLGAVIRGDTPHFDYVCREVARGIAQASCDTGVPVIFGVLTTENVAQAEKRVKKGKEAVQAALRMIKVLSAIDK